MEATISKRWLLVQLAKAAQVRSLVTLSSMLPLLACIGYFFPARSLDQLGPFILIPVFGPPMIVAWLLTCNYCRKAVVCPFCGGSLWSCGSGNFKPRR